MSQICQTQMLDSLPVAVMPTVLLGGPIALWAFLFPAVCSGLTIRFRRWRPVFRGLAISSTLCVLHGWFGQHLFRNWWEGQLELWLLLLTVAVVGFLQEGSQLCSQEKIAQIPHFDVALLGVAAILNGFLLFGMVFLPTWTLASFTRQIAVAEGAAIGTLIWIIAPNAKLGIKRPAWGGPKIIFFFTAIGCLVVFGSVSLQAFSSTSVALSWTFSPEQEGAVYSTPLVVGTNIYTAVALDGVGRGSGALYCLDGSNGEMKWSFTDEGRMRPVLSSPCFFNNSILIGEGFHEDAPCKLYCISAHSGEKLWDFATSSHTESSPNVVDGQVYFGAGDDGLYSLDAATGRQLWHFAGPHVDCCPAVFDGRVFAGSGYGVYEVFSVDALNGQPVWRVPVDLPSFGSPTVAEDHVLFGIGNGSVSLSDPQPAGALLCVDAKTGDLKWRFDTRDGVHGRPLVHQGHVFFASRDQYCYCIEVASGRLRWKRELGSPVVAAPVLAQLSVDPSTQAIHFLSREGRLACLSTETGLPYWTVDARDFAQAEQTFISTPVIRSVDSSLGNGARIYLAGCSRGLVVTPTLFCLQ